MQTLKSAFDKLDREGQGLIQAGELKVILESVAADEQHLFYTIERLERI